MEVEVEGQLVVVGGHGHRVIVVKDMDVGNRMLREIAFEANILVHRCRCIHAHHTAKERERERERERKRERESERER